MKTRILSLFLALLLIVTALPIQAISVFATDNEGTEWIDFDIHRAQCILGIAKDPEGVIVGPCHDLYSYYIDEEIYSPTQTFLDEAYADDDLMAEFAMWQTISLGADVSSLTDVPLQRKDYYEALIIAIMTQELKKNEDNALIEAVGYANSIIDGLKNMYGVSSKMALIDKFPDLNTPESLKAFEDLYDSNPKLGACDVLELILGFSTTVIDAAERIAAYHTMLSLDTYTKDWLNAMYDCAYENNADITLIDALSNLKNASSSFTEAVLVDIKDTSFRLATWAVGATANTTITLWAATNPLTAILLTGIKLGKTISDMCFGASDVFEQFFLLECMYDVQDIARKVTKECENTFINNQTKENAVTFNYAVHFYFESIINTDIDCMIQFLDTLYNGGYLKGVIKWMYGATNDYQDAVNSLENLRKTRQENYGLMIGYSNFALYYYYPEVYELYFPGEEPVEIPITGFEINLYEFNSETYPYSCAHVYEDSFSAIEVKCIPSNTTQKAYEITVENPEILEIDENNTIKGLAIGTTNVTVTSKFNPNISYTTEVRVGKSPFSFSPDNPDTEQGLSTKFTYTVNNNEATITGLVSGYNPSTLRIPSYIDGYRVISIGKNAFDVFYYNFKSINISNSVTSIGDYAFKNCDSLTSVTIGDSVTSIGVCAFQNCKSLPGITIPDSVTSIGNCAFKNCKSLTVITIPDSVISIGDGAFDYCDSLTSVTIGNGVIGIGGGVFFGCNSLKSVTIGNSVTSIGYEAFGSCSALTNITIPDSVTSIEDYAFYRCKSLTSITIPDSVISIGNGAFEACTSLASITIPDGVTSIGYGTFSNCSSLTSVTIGNSVTSIGNAMFASCTSLTSITIPDNVTSIGNAMFASCTSLTSITIPDSVTSIGYSAFSGCSSLVSVIIPDSVTSIGGEAFSSCTSLTNITIPDSVTSIEYDVFYKCTSLANATIPDSVTSIGAAAFFGCSALTSITIPDSVTSIGGEAFRGCTSLKSITIPDSVTSIGSYAFMDCNSLKSITIPDSVTSIGVSAFYACSSLTTVYYKGSEEEWSNISIKSNNSPLSNANIIFNYSPVVITPGDANGDGVVNSRDTLTFKKHIAGLVIISEDFLKNADITGDNVINSRDMLALKRLLTQK